MAEPIIISKANVLKPAEDYDLLRKEGIKHIEKLSGDIWTDYNTHDPGITLLEALCYAITDLSYRTGFEMKDLLAPEHLDENSWKNIFYTARQILPSNPVTINDYRKLLIDITGVRNAWITISEGCEVPIYISYPVFDTVKNSYNENNPNPCNDENKIQVKLAFKPDNDDPTVTKDKIIELNGLYKIIIEYEEDIIEKKQKGDIRKDVLKKLHCNRSLCEDFVSITAAEYRDFLLKTDVIIKDDADPEKALAEMCFRIQNYFTPSQKFYTLEELLEKGKHAEDIFEGPFLKHGFIPDEELEKTDLFRDMRLSDIINSVADIEGIIALSKFKVNDNLFPDNPANPDDQEPFDKDDPCRSERYFDEWIAGMKKEKLVGRLNIADIIEHANDKDKNTVPGVVEPAPIRVFKSGNRLTINTDRFNKLLKDLKTLDRNNKLKEQSKDFPVPIGQNLELQDYFPVQYSLPKTYKVGEEGLPVYDDNKRLAQALQLKGYLAVFEQLFMNFLAQLNNVNQLFSFNEITHTSFAGKIIDHDPDDNDKLKEQIAGYLHLYVDSERYIKEIEVLTEFNSLPGKEDESPKESFPVFESRRNNILEHLLARFSEELNEYSSLMRFLYPKDHLKRIIKNKTDLLSDYISISKNRGRAYNYKLEEECLDTIGENKDEEIISCNVSGVERRVSRLLGFKDFKRKYITPENLFFDTTSDGRGKIRLYDGYDKKTWLLESEDIRLDCEDDFMHCFIESGCCSNNFVKIPEQKEEHARRKKHYSGGYSFILRDGNEIRKKTIATSPLYSTEDLRDEAMGKAIKALKRICHEEGMHMIEHILLRPKGDDQQDNFELERRQPPGPNPDSFTLYELLDVCLDKCDLNIGNNNPNIPTRYKFEVRFLKIHECTDKKRWQVELKRIAAPENILITKETFHEYKQASEFISMIREYGSEFANFKIWKNDETPVKYFFRLFNEKGTAIFESDTCYTTMGNNPFFKKKDIKEAEKRNSCTDAGEADVWKEIKWLKEYLAYEHDLYCCEDACDHNEDPYSFRVSFVLPCWPKRFRDKSFRHFVEKTIQSETAAHIHAKVYWLGIEQMRVFENTWYEWLVEMACHDVPDISIMNDFIKVVKGLKNCDQPCKENAEAHDD
ncbi:MAG TPA: hypothetical protein VIU35_18445 [Chitinophagaceae bacterium]